LAGAGCVSNQARHLRDEQASGRAVERAQQGRFFFYTPDQVAAAAAEVLQAHGAKVARAADGLLRTEPFTHSDGSTLSAEVLLTSGAEGRERYVKVNWRFREHREGEARPLGDDAVTQSLAATLNQELFNQLSKTHAY
jgi:hypothetical protein